MKDSAKGSSSRTELFDIVGLIEKQFMKRFDDYRVAVNWVQRRWNINERFGLAIISRSDKNDNIIHVPCFYDQEKSLFDKFWPENEVSLSDILDLIDEEDQLFFIFNLDYFG